MTRWPGAISSQVRGRPVATGSVVVVFADGGLRLGRELHDDLAVQVLPDVRHKALAVGVEPTKRQFLGKGGQFFGGRFIDLEVHELGGLGDQIGIGGWKPSRPWLLLFVVAEHDEELGVRGVGGFGLQLWS